jgi:hypothetical protein
MQDVPRRKYASVTPLDRPIRPGQHRGIAVATVCLSGVAEPCQLELGQDTLRTQIGQEQVELDLSTCVFKDGVLELTSSGNGRSFTITFTNPEASREWSKLIETAQSFTKAKPSRQDSSSSLTIGSRSSQDPLSQLMAQAISDPSTKSLRKLSERLKHCTLVESCTIANALHRPS